MKNQTIEYTDNVVKFVIPCSYEVMYYSDTKFEVWRHQEGLYPEEAIEGRWISDFGLGDYEVSRECAIRKVRYKRESELPESIKKFIEPANKREREFKELMKSSVKTVENKLSQPASLKSYLKRLLSFLVG